MPFQIKNKQHIHILTGQPGLQIAQPSLTSLDNGQYALLYRKSPYTPGSQRQRVHPQSRAAMLVTTDPLDWTNAQHIEIPGQTPGSGHTPAMHPLGGDKYMLIDYNFEYFDETERPVETFKDITTGHWVGRGGAHTRQASRNPDGSWTFTPERKITTETRTLIYTSNSARRVSEQEYIIPCHNYDENQLIDNEIFLIRTTDGGLTWHDHALIDKRERKYAILKETAIAPAGNGEYAVLIRTTNKFDYLLSSRSIENGTKWPRPERTEIQGHPATLITLANHAIAPPPPHPTPEPTENPPGNTNENTPQNIHPILCASALNIKKHAIRLTLSLDNGQTWDTPNTLDLEANLPEGDFGWPHLAQLKDASLLCAYHTRDENNQYTLHAIHFQLEI